MSLMTATYVGAKYVMLLESLQSIPCEVANSSTFEFHLMSCRWMGRAWTLQEGALASARALWYNFNDGPGLSIHHRIE
jgi:hypothetical protein